jgi:hypothetical protein
LEYHSSNKGNESQETLQKEDLPSDLVKFLNVDINLCYDSNSIADNSFLKQDAEIDKLTEFYSLFNGQYVHINNIYLFNLLNKEYFLVNNDKVVTRDKLMQFKNKKHEFSNITQNYFYCHNKEEYVG